MRAFTHAEESYASDGKLLRRAAVVSGLMVAASLAAVRFEPTRAMAEGEGKLHLESMIPASFGDWKIDRSLIPIAPPPDLQATLDRTYEQTLSRTYIDPVGNRIMLSIAYGGRYGESMQTHKPEICYPAQGFQIVRKPLPTEISTAFGTIRATSLVAAASRRIEPITYWLVIGAQQTEFGMSMKLVQFKYGLTGMIPDGLLIRVSSIGEAGEPAFEKHAEFVRALMGAIDTGARARLIGKVV